MIIPNSITVGLLMVTNLSRLSSIYHSTTYRNGSNCIFNVNCIINLTYFLCVIDIYDSSIYPKTLMIHLFIQCLILCIYLVHILPSVESFVASIFQDLCEGVIFQ